MSDTEFKRMSLGEHLEELRRRLFLSLIALTLGVAVCLPFKVQSILLWVVCRPYVWGVGSEAKLTAFYLGEQWLVFFQLSLIAGLLISFPAILYQAWAFVAAGLRRNERRAILMYAPLSFLLFAGGVAFAYRILLPVSISFLAGYGDGKIEVMLNLSAYLDFFLILTLAIGAVFELPLIMLFLTRIGLIPVDAYSGKRKAAILIAFIVAAIVTPTPDPVTQTLLAVPLIALYELGILLARLGGRAPPPASEPAP